MSRFPTINKLLEKTAEQGYFFSSFVRNIFKGSFEFNEFTRQCFVIGYKSLGIVALTGFIVGFVFTLQSLPTLKTFGAQSFAPGMVCISVIREIGPVITGLICSGKIASSIGAELGSMNVTEQIDAMEVSGANPVKYLVVTRILACTLMIPLLTLFADAFSIAGGFIGINTSAKMSLDLYLTKSFETLYFSDLFPAMVKSTFFGFAIGFVGCYKGYTSNKGTESVGLAANSAVVAASIWIIIIDAVAVQVTSVFIYN